MSRMIHALLVVLLFVGSSFGMRYVYRYWADAAVKEALAVSAKESAKWKNMKSAIPEIKIDSKMLLPPKVELRRTPGKNSKN